MIFLVIVLLFMGMSGDQSVFFEFSKNCLIYLFLTMCFALNLFINHFLSFNL